jgi:hypothetical protein
VLVSNGRSTINDGTVLIRVRTVLYHRTDFWDPVPLKAGLARGRDAVPLGRGGGDSLCELRSCPPALTLSLLAVTLRLRFREGPARAPRVLPLPLPPLPLLFPASPTELPSPALPRLVVGRGGISTSLSEDVVEESSPPALASLLLISVARFRCSRKSLTTCCRRLLA